MTNDEKTFGCVVEEKVEHRFQINHCNHQTLAVDHLEHFYSSAVAEKKKKLKINKGVLKNEQFFFFV